MSQFEAIQFYIELRQQLAPGDILITGVNLKKNPRMIMTAYYDAAGITRKLILTCWKELTGELSVNFEVSLFDHSTTYDQQTGACKSFHVSLKAQEVKIGADRIRLRENDVIQMEVFQKYAPGEIGWMVEASGF